MNASSSLVQAAIILKSLPKQQAAGVLSRLKPADIHSVLDAVKSLDRVTARQIGETLERLKEESRRLQGTPDGNDYVDELLEATEKVRVENDLTVQVADEADSSHPFDFLINALPMVRNQLIQDEHPKNIALVLSMLPPDQASSCMKSLEPVERVSVLKRICEIEELDESDVSELSYALRLRHKKLVNKHRYQTAGVVSAAALLSCSDPEQQETLITLMNQSDPDLAEKLQRSVLKIEDLDLLQDQEIKTLLRNVDTACWAPAMKHASFSVQSKILSNMAPQPAKMLNEEMASLGDIDDSIQNIARQQIINVALQLHEQGKIKVHLIENPTRPTMPTEDLFTQSSFTTSPIS